ncbi:4-hydroxyacetophenone monooxygenase domain protein [Teladorsagia circumcincta]|uniref:4-hydroxyacetophenone monooxygenase domain protein n=1 Tax=Teladorsagia circumcincta TaxID=45464 RepID=A0A2G9UK45_TELCI|nr:4-hydroxyacetophenone monooxygenase domain protein [Teladorsagia circumcincta]
MNQEDEGLVIMKEVKPSKLASSGDAHLNESGCSSHYCWFVAGPKFWMCGARDIGEDRSHCNTLSYLKVSALETCTNDQLQISGINGTKPSGPPNVYAIIRNDSIGGTKVRVYTPEKRRSRAALVFIHGGGWATMRADYYDDFMNVFIRRLGVTVFSIDYRLAPEYPFPYPVDDCEAVVSDLYHDSWKRFDIDRDKICVAGDSAGGNLAAVVTQRYNGTSLLNPRAMARWILLYLGLPADKRNVELLLSNQHISE